MTIAIVRYGWTRNTGVQEFCGLVMFIPQRFIILHVLASSQSWSRCIPQRGTLLSLCEVPKKEQARSILACVSGFPPKLPRGTLRIRMQLHWTHGPGLLNMPSNICPHHRHSQRDCSQHCNGENSLPGSRKSKEIKNSWDCLPSLSAKSSKRKLCKDNKDRGRGGEKWKTFLP